MTKAPLELLDRIIAVDAGAGRPLHLQLRRSLQQVIEKHFKDGDRFFSETELIRHLGVSQITVRRALSDLANEGLIERRVAKGSFVRKKVNDPAQVRAVGMFVPAFDSDFFTQLVGQLSRLCWQMQVSMSVYHTERGRKVADAFRCLKNSASQERVLLIGTDDSATELLAAFSERGYRVVVLDSPIGVPCNFVGVDNVAGIRLGLNHLLELGHREIAFLVNEPMVGPNTTARIEAYRALMVERGLRPNVIDCGCERWASSYDAAYRAMAGVLAGPVRPTAIFAVSDAGGWAALRWCAEKGIEVPTELSILGFDDEGPSRFMQPAMSTVAQPMQEIAETAMRLLWDESGQTSHELLAPRLVVRGSTAAPPVGLAPAGQKHFGNEQTL